MAVMGGQEGQPVDNVVGMSWLSVPSAGDEFGANVVVQEFARIEGTFVVGTAWTDSNTNGTLDFGEGLDSVTVTLDHGEWHAQTLTEGGFVLPVVAHEQYVIEFRRDGYKPLRQIIEVGDINVLVNVALTPAV